MNTRTRILLKPIALLAAHSLDAAIERLAAWGYRTFEQAARIIALARSVA